MKTSALLSISLAFIAQAAFANPSLLLEDSFERDELGEGWTVLNGTWDIRDGVLHIKELAADEHAASGRRVLEFTDATFDLRFSLSEGTNALHIGFDPAKGELDKKGHLFSVIVMPDRWRIMKHIDKSRPEEDPNEILAQTAHDFSPGQWYQLSLKIEGTSVHAKIEGVGELDASHPTFSVKKPTLVLRTAGETSKIDDLKVTVEKKTTGASE